MIYNYIKGCVKIFPPRTRADVGMVQCVSEGHGKPPDSKNIGISDVCIGNISPHTSALQLGTVSYKYRHRTKCRVTTSCYDSGVVVLHVVSPNQSASSFI